MPLAWPMENVSLVSLIGAASTCHSGQLSPQVWLGFPVGTGRAVTPTLTSCVRRARPSPGPSLSSLRQSLGC